MNPAVRTAINRRICVRYGFAQDNLRSWISWSRADDDDAPSPRARPRGRPPGPLAWRAGGTAGRQAGPAPHDRLGRAGTAAPGRPLRRRPRAGAVGEPPRRRRPRRRSGWSTASPSRLGRAAPRRGRRPADAGAEGRSGSVQLRLPGGREVDPGRRAAASGSRRRVRAGSTGSRTDRERLVKPARRPAAAALDLPHRRHRRHLRGHPAGPGRRARGRRHHRRHPVHRAVACSTTCRRAPPARGTPGRTPPRRTSG